TATPVDSVTGASAVVGVFLLGNDDPTPLGEWQLQARTGEIDLRVFDMLATGGMPVDGASYYLYRQSSGVVVPADVTDDDPLVDGAAVIDGLLPGQYRLEVRRYATPGDPASGQVAFPTIVIVTVDPSIEGATSRVVVRAPLPSLAPT